MTIEEILSLITGISPFSIIKIFLILFLLFYICFAWVVLRQEKFMSQVVEAPISPILALLAKIHFWASVALFILALVVL